MNTAIATQATKTVSDLAGSFVQAAGPVLKAALPAAAWRFARRNPGVAIAIGVGTAVLAGVAGWAKTKDNAAEEPKKAKRPAPRAKAV